MLQPHLFPPLAKRPQLATFPCWAPCGLQADVRVLRVGGMIPNHKDMSTQSLPCSVSPTDHLSSLSPVDYCDISQGWRPVDSTSGVNTVTFITSSRGQFKVRSSLMLWKVVRQTSFQAQRKRAVFLSQTAGFSHPFIHSLIWQPISDAETEVCAGSLYAWPQDNTCEGSEMRQREMLSSVSGNRSQLTVILKGALELDHFSLELLHLQARAQDLSAPLRGPLEEVMSGIKWSLPTGSNSQKDQLACPDLWGNGGGIWGALLSVHSRCQQDQHLLNTSC